MRRHITILIFVLLSTVVAQGQIKIGGNVYGGGNKGEVKGSTKVTVKAGNIGARPLDEVNERAENPRGKVFGGARMANVGGNAYVNIDGAHASDYIVINQVFGGNDIAGKINTNPEATKELPTELATNPDGVTSEWDAYVHISSKLDNNGEVASDNKKIFIGQVFSGGNGDYTYTTDDKGNYVVAQDEETIATSASPLTPPELKKTYLDIQGASIVYAYGGGNNATITENAVIHVDNPSTVVTDIKVDANGKEKVDGTNILTTARQRDMGVNSVYASVSSDAFQINRLFGGNNKADMDLQPQWNLQSGKIRNLYSGGNRGRMIWHEGLLLEVKSPNLVIDNVYGGCRMADVHPLKWNKDTQQYDEVSSISGIVGPYLFPDNLAARVIVSNGNVHNVYGGNDVRGKVYFGNAVGIHTSISGNVYGGGNGAYAYTDNEQLANTEEYGDYYYSTDGFSDDPVEAINAIRPDAEQVSIDLRGTVDNPTIIHGSVFVGGNCATLESERSNPLAELKIGSHVIAENVFLGNNGDDMVSEEILKYYKNEIKEDFSSLNLSESSVFDTYMKGVIMTHVPRLVVEDKTKGDPYDYDPYTSYIGSLYYGGNRGSMAYSGPINITPNAPIYIYNKLVGGCNNANVAETTRNARYEGGILGDADEQKENGFTDGGHIRDRIVMNLTKIRLKPMRLNSEGTGLEWNTVINGVKTGTGEGTGIASADDKARRLVGGNIYGGCCVSGHVNGNVKINLNGSMANRHDIFAAFEGEESDDNILYEPPTGGYNITERNSGVILNEQGMDVLGEALTVYGGGKGNETEVWGSATVNINKGYTFQVFGGSEEGAIGKGTWNASTNKYDYPEECDEQYSTYVNLNGPEDHPGVPRSADASEEIPDVEFIYGGGFSGPIVGNTYVHLDNGRLFNLFTGSCNADIMGHTETYVGLNGFPYLRDHIYGGNDLGGEIKGSANFTDKVSTTETLDLVLPTDLDDGTGKGKADGVRDVLQANTYVEYRKGNMKDIFGGCFGDYDYNKDFTVAKDYKRPELNNAFINFRPEAHSQNHVDMIFGAGEGCLGDRVGDMVQNRSYVLIDIPDNQEEFANTEVFGSGMNNGLGTKYGTSEIAEDGFNGDKASAIIDLAHGMIGAAYGGSYNEGVTVRTVVRVPSGATDPDHNKSTINIKEIFGGAYGTDALPPCDVYSSNVEYNSDEAVVRGGGIYGGNNNVRRTLYTKVNINSPVYANTAKNSLATVYGAGFGELTWAEYTWVNLNEGAQVSEVYGGGQDGLVLNAESIRDYMKMFSSANVGDDKTKIPPHCQASFAEKYENDMTKWPEVWREAWRLGEYFNPETDAAFDTYPEQPLTNLINPLLTRTAEMDDRNLTEGQKAKMEKKYNTNVIINKGAIVERYAYGGGLGDADKPNSGDVLGTTYIALLGGTVGQDIYAAGTTGSVYNLYGSNDFTASANAYIEGGTVRNVFGGGWRGSVGKHTKIEGGNIVQAPVSDSYTGDLYGETHVVIGTASGTGHDAGVPSITRNVYGGGEGGAIYGTANVKMNNGYIGYRYDSNLSDNPETAHIDERYVEELDDAAPGDKLLEKGGNIFGGGYVANSYVDHTEVKMYGGTVRGSLHGGGEIGPVGRGSMLSTAPSTGITNQGAKIYKAGTTHVQLYDGWVKRNVFGGGRGYDNWGGDGYMTDKEKETMDRSAKGYVFGQTEVDIYGGEVGTDEGVALGYGNVFGGGDVGFIYSAYEKDGTLCFGKKPDNSKRYDDGDEGYYYKYENNAYALLGTEKILTEDCKVVVEPWCKTNSAITLNGQEFNAGDYVPTSYLNYLGNKNEDKDEWSKFSKADVNKEGIIIHNAVFAGGNTQPGSSTVTANTTTVFGNATASIHDIYHRDLITVGTGHTGGLYGDGNLTLIDGYRELNITNYGTDYYSISSEITLEAYKALPDREAAYYELRYKCKKQCTDKNGKTYAVGSTITQDELSTVFEGVTVKVTVGEPPVATEQEVSMLDANEKPQEEYWEENGVCSRYAGRIMNTIQRADFCGVYGSRMVMQGAPDRVVEVADYTNYTINRVREVSLNKKASVRSVDINLDLAEHPEDYYRRTIHGNYFGIYNIVNYLGALTSDVDFGDIRITENTSNPGLYINPTANGKAYGTASYYEWKGQFNNDRRRNNGSSYNKVALASGVYLELTTENGTGTSLYEKDWGYITGIVELDLINVQPGVGGGFVYAKNVHGQRIPTYKTQTTLTALNTGAVTRKNYSYYTDDDHKEAWQTSGNFIHSTQTIVDDCYSIGNRYKGAVTSDGRGAMPAHYWFIKGSIYVYDQYISAYTGSPNAFSEMVNIPLTITSASHGKLTLIDVMPNLYAYYSVNTGSGASLVQKKLGESDEIVLRDVTYKLNDPISYWDWQMLTAAERKLFVRETYVTSDSCKMNDNDNTVLPKGYVMLPDEYTAWSEKTIAQTDEEGGESILSVIIMTKDAAGNEVPETDLEGNLVYKAFTDVFHESNNMSHDKGYILTYSVDNPSLWSTWYTKKDDAAHEKNQTGGTGYEDGPTYWPSTSGLYGQLDYKVGNIIAKNVYTTYSAGYSSMTTGMTTAEKDALDETQATFERAYIVTVPVLEATNNKDVPQRFYKDATLAKSDYVKKTGETTDETLWNAISSSVAEAYVVTKTIQLSATKFIYMNTKMTQIDKNQYISEVNEEMNAISKGASSLTVEGINALTGITDAQKSTLLSLLATKTEMNEVIVPAYYCTKDGKYGGNYFQTGNNYRAIESFCSLTDDDRSKLNFNYDALDLLIDPNFGNPETQKYQYDGTTDKNNDHNITENDVDNPAHYSLKTPIDYQATYTGNDPLIYNYQGIKKNLSNGATIDREEYESLLNERYYYSPISVSKENDVIPPYYYVVKETIILGDTPYAAGQVIDKSTYDGLNDTEKAKVAVLNFTEEGTYYYCREKYTIDAGDDGKPVSSATNATAKKYQYNEETEKYEYVDATINKTYNKGDEVEAGVVIDNSTFSSLTNKQTDFTVHGLSPTETSTLYVVRNSDIKDLSTEKIITVIYQYDYVETGQGGMNITPVSERHVLNIHINFKSGVPTVEDILPPNIVLPGTSISINEPHVEAGAYEVTGGGWELFDDVTDAESHTNGIEYTPNDDPLFLYQNNYLMAYYAQTYLGKTYSNAVPVHVANYHDLKKVMGDKDHHYYIDHDNVHKEQKVQPKIYINDYSKDANGSKNGLDLFKDLYDLSLVTGSGYGYTVTDNKITETTGESANSNLMGHALLNTNTRAERNLEFFLRADIEHTGSWTPIGYDAVCDNPSTTEDEGATGKCFDGVFHGDGHTISGLDHSLFNYLCGEVYNLGVMGSFTGAGVAETGGGYVENCWVNTTGTPAEGVRAVFGNPTATSGYKQVVNSYCQEGKTYNTTDTDHHGIATAKPDKSFYNGEVAYNLNGFYLYKRYNDGKNTTSGVEYKYWKEGEDDPQTGYYADNMLQGFCSSGYNGIIKYVEERFADGDFIYDGGNEGIIPKTANERLDATSGEYYPIWPDDYIFFGQRLNYGYGDLSHQDVPTTVVRDKQGHLSQGADANRIYRAPAYFRLSKMDVAHFNADAVFAKTKKGDDAVVAYKDMTAIDFTGSNGDISGGYQQGNVSTGSPATTKFYPPLLDNNDGLTGFHNIDLTQNLLVYTSLTGGTGSGETPTAAQQTANIVSNALNDEAYTETNPLTYRTVAFRQSSNVKGHQVQQTGTGTFEAMGDHFLVDKQDFNAPISYSFANDHRMWYQRTPENYVEIAWSNDPEPVRTTKGWEAVSLPFKAELVTTNQKGELTHFYQGSTIGHEYWLREFKGGSISASNNKVFEATFNYPDASSGDGPKVYTNTFLWDYYYKATAGHNQQDANNDTYQTYYNSTQTYSGYPLLANATPYIIGFPGEQYYEFDLSGEFEPTTTASPNPAQLSRQTITFASKPNATIAVSDKETTGVNASSDYTFLPNYLNETFAANTANTYTLNGDGNSFDIIPDDKSVDVGAFRPYFVKKVNSSRQTRSIVFTQHDEDLKPKTTQASGTLESRAERHGIVVSSTLTYAADVRIVAANGVTVRQFTIQPSETVETPIVNRGVYIVQSSDGQHVKKHAVK